MRSRGITISPDALASEALRVLEQRRITSVVVTDETQTVLGVLHLHDLWGVGLF
jgi:arabinose-5-phosphate isomerase